MLKPTRTTSDNIKDMASSEPSDAELIREYVSTKSPKIFEALVRRHYNIVHKRLLSITKNTADADDLAQKLWLRVLENLANYQDKQKFPHFLNTIASNLLKDEWRRSGVRNESSLNQMQEDGNQAVELLDENEDMATELGNRAEITYLVRELIPSLSTKLRTVFLLKHESEYWDGKQPFQWQHLADLNGVSEAQVYADFLVGRDGLISGDLNADALSDEQRSAFLVWTQAQRLDKSKTQTETYLSKLLGIPVNTFKTRYRKALAELSSGLELWRTTKS